MYYDNQREWKINNGFVSTEDAIQTPIYFYKTNYIDWSLGHNYDYWNTNFTGATNANNILTAKTVYDPSISGFTLPRTAAFTGFTKTGNNTTNSNDFNSSGDFDHGWYFMAGAQSVIIFFEALGYRNTSTGIINDVGREGHYWTSGASSASISRVFYFYSGGVYPFDEYARSSGFSVRPVLE